MEIIRVLVITAEDDDTSVPIFLSCFIYSDISNNHDRPVSRTKAPKEAGTEVPGMFCTVTTAFKETHEGFQ